jgi:1,2-diacylglycerol 3-alpha-glucosyltransferase
LIEAVIRLANPKIHLIVVGDAGTGDEDYPRMLSKMAMNHQNIHFVGWLNQRQIYAYLDMSDLAVFPASQSILWQQAISMGLPLIVGDVGHQDISYLNLQNNIVVLRGADICSDIIANVIARLVADRGLMNAMKDGARVVADEHLDWNRLISRTLRFNTQSP